MKDKPRKLTATEKAIVQEHLAHREAHEVLPSDTLNRVSLVQLELHKLQELTRLVWHSADEGFETYQAKMTRVVDLYIGLRPIDAGEGMLAMQMVATHTTGMECMYRAADPELPIEQRNESLEMACKLLDLFARQLGQFDRHRHSKLKELDIPGWGEALYHEELTRENRAGNPSTPQRAVEVTFDEPGADPRLNSNQDNQGA